MSEDVWRPSMSDAATELRDLAEGFIDGLGPTSFDDLHRIGEVAQQLMDAHTKGIVPIPRWKLSQGGTGTPP